MLFLFVNMSQQGIILPSFIKLCSPKLILEMQVHDSATFLCLRIQLSQREAKVLI